MWLGDLRRPPGSGRCTTVADCNVSRGEDCVDVTLPLGGTSRVCRGPTARGSGLFLGDFLIFSEHPSLFVPGTGYDTESDIRHLFDDGVDTLSSPLSLDAVYAIGDRV